MKALLGRFLGNGSLWAFGIGVVLFKAWLWYFHYPDDAEVAVLWGWILVPVSQAAAVINFVLGWLVAVYSLKNIQKILIHFFKPLELVESADTKAFFSAPATFVVSLLFAGFVLDLALANIAVRIGSRYEVVALLPRGSDAFLFNDSGSMGEHFSIPAGGAVRLALRGHGAREIVLLRDQYNLVTLDAFALERSRSLLRATSPKIQLEKDGEGSLELVAGTSGTPHRRGVFDFEVTGPLRYSARKVDLSIQPAGGLLMEGGYLRPGEEAPCPERTPVEYATRFFADLCRNRSEFGMWTDRPTYRLDAGPTVAHTIGSYGIEIRYRNGQTKFDNGEPVFSREATMVVANETGPTPKAEADGKGTSR